MTKMTKTKTRMIKITTTMKKTRSTIGTSYQQQVPKMMKTMTMMTMMTMTRRAQRVTKKIQQKTGI